MHDRYSFTKSSEQSQLSSSSLFTLIYHSLKTSFNLPNSLRSSAKRARDGYLNFLSSQASAKTPDPSSNPELFARFLAFVVEGIDAGASVPLDSRVELSRLLLDVLETIHLKGEDVHTFAAELACSKSRRPTLASLSCHNG